MPKGIYKHNHIVWNKGKKGLQIAWNKGKPWSKDAKEKMSLAKKGKKYPNRKKPPLFSKEHKQKISEATRGEKNPMYGRKFKHTLEARAKIREAGKGRVFSEETRKKIGDVKRGKPNFKLRGENAPNWKGGITPINRAIRTCLEYKLWRKSVFERDNYQCIWGGKEHGSKLNADHIKPFALFPELRFAIDNGRTLCEDCHRKTDTFGYKNNTKIIKY